MYLCGSLHQAGLVHRLWDRSQTWKLGMVPKGLDFIFWYQGKEQIDTRASQACLVPRLAETAVIAGLPTSDLARVVL